MKISKERIYITELLEDPVTLYPMYYTVSERLAKDEMLLDALKALHTGEFGMYRMPEEASEIFAALRSGGFAIYKEVYVVGSFGGRLMYLESAGWKSMTVTEAVFEMSNWLIP
ncbi:MAG: hypothetical protein B6D59_06810 [Campylobacteraceae bacterium 4484_4]|nr:MAG: hypothetical protein B6D59_06810 [Campylobacteraceae bacterium 4484_4]